MSDNRPDLWQKVSSALPKLHSTRPNNFSIFFANLSHVLLTFVFERKKPSSEKKLQSVLSNLHSKRPRNFWRFFFRKHFFFNLIWILRQNYSKFDEILQQNRQKWNLPVQRNTLTKTLLAFWNKYRLWAKKFRIFGKKFAGLLSNEHCLFPDGQLEEYFLRTSREQFLFFFRWIFLGMVVETDFSCQEEHIHYEKYFEKTFFIISGLWGNFS